jgi:MYXO-CTERM domain-containing protein
MYRASSSFIRWLAAFTFLMATVLGVQPVAAAGRVKWKSTTLEERDNKSWQVEVELYLTKAPDTAHMPVKFEFDPVAYYERSMVDGKDQPVERVVPLTGRQALIESVDIGFMDPGTGKIEKRTRFSFKVTRAHGYEAGEYRVTIRDGRSGAVIGTPTTLKFKGENEIIDRRAIVFTGESKKKKKEPADAGASDTTASDTPEENTADPMEPGEDPFAEDDSQDPDAVEKKSGGCGCRVVEDSSSMAGLSLLGLGLVIGLGRRKSKRAA